MSPLILDSVTVAQHGNAPVPAIPHFGFPFAFQQHPDGTIQAATTEQDSLQEIFDCAQAIVACPIGFRDDLPTFGVPYPEFHQTPLDSGPIRRAIGMWEPRAELESAEYADLSSPAWRHVRIDVRSSA